MEIFVEIVLFVVDCFYCLDYFQLFDLNSFFLKALLWVKTSNLLNLWRLLLLGFLAALALRECYQFIIDSSIKDIGPASWIMGIVLLLETIVWIKWGYSDYSQIPFPFHIKWFWSISLSFLTFFCVIYFIYKERIHHKKMNKKKIK